MKYIPGYTTNMTYLFNKLEYKLYETAWAVKDTQRDYLKALYLEHPDHTSPPYILTWWQTSLNYFMTNSTL